MLVEELQERTTKEMTRNMRISQCASLMSVLSLSWIELLGRRDSRVRGIRPDLFPPGLRAVWEGELEDWTFDYRGNEEMVLYTHRSTGR